PPHNNPILLTPHHSSKAAGIIPPPDWAPRPSTPPHPLTRPNPLLCEKPLRVYTNGISLTAQPGSLTLSQPVSDPLQPDQIHIPTLAQQYTRSLPNHDYPGLAIEPRPSLIVPDQGDDAARHYIQNLLSPNWQSHSPAPQRASLSLSYDLGDQKFNLSIAAVQLQREDEAPQAAVLFSGNFPYPLNDESEKLEQLSQHLQGWQRVWERYRGIVGQFLG
ncbi:hypothetical protein HC928_11765, partial [bacterium]|nr:hypothetical protein [bacterium]